MNANKGINVALLKTMKKLIFITALVAFHNIATGAETALDLGFIETIHGLIIPDGSHKIFSVARESELQKQIDQATLEIFQSHLGKSLCKIYPTKATLIHSLGINLNTAKIIEETICGIKNESHPVPKNSPKGYIIRLDEEGTLPIQSWTTPNNNTIIFVDADLDYINLKRILAHEIAILHDAKMNMLLTTYFYLLGKYKTEVISLPAKLNAYEEKLRQTFNFTLYQPIGYTFATLRAYNFEASLMNEKQDTLISHENCAKSFKSLFSFFEKNDLISTFGAYTLQGQFALLLSTNSKPMDVEQTINNILDPSIKLQEFNNITFCQYMATPVLNGKSHWTFTSSGPRPRITGGWKTTDEIQDQKEYPKELNKEDSLASKPRLQITEPANPRNPLLLDIIKNDFQQNKLNGVQDKWQQLLK